MTDMTRKVVIREVDQRDAAEIAAIYNHYVVSTTVSFETEPLSPEDMLRRIRNLSSGYPYFVAVVDGRVEGYCYAHPWKERAAYSLTWETTVYLRDGIGRSGLGRMLMTRLIDACRQRGCRSLIACITAENEASVSFHRSLGFMQVSDFKKVGFKLGRFLDVVDFQLLL